MTAASIADSTHSASCLSRGLALLGLGSKPRTPLTEKNLNQHDSGSETSSTESWFTVEKPSKTPSGKLPSDSASDLRVETYEEDLPLYTEKSTLAVSVRYKYHELFFLVKPSTRVKSLKVSCPTVAGGRHGEDLRAGAENSAHSQSITGPRASCAPSSCSTYFVTSKLIARLNYNGHKLRNRMTIAELGIEDGDEILCMLDFGEFVLGSADVRLHPHGWVDSAHAPRIGGIVKV